MINLTELLKSKFGHDQFRPGQEEIIQSVLSKRDVLAILPTGAGKTLCYHFPAKLMEGMTIVVSPLLSLMEDQVHQLRAAGDKNVVQLNGLLTFEEKKRILRSLNKNSILFISPEMLTNDLVIRRVSGIQIGLFVVDEAHCISQWGHEFRTDYLRLHEVKERIGNPPCLALTATATSQVEEDIIKKLAMEQPVIHRFSVNRKQIKLITVEAFDKTEKLDLFFEHLKRLVKPAIIYTSTRKEAVAMAETMKEKGYVDVAFYHGGMTKEDRLLIQHQFLNNEINYICSTNAFGMGINKPNVRSVIHLHIPPSIEQYVQEIGRAGRDGQESTALLLYTKEDRAVPMAFIDQEFPTERELKTWFSVLKGWNPTTPLVDSSVMEELQRVLFIDETRWKMLLYYFRKFGALDDKHIHMERVNDQLFKKLYQHFLSRRKHKENNFYQIESLLNGKECIRKGVLQYFGEEMTGTLKKCCSNCGLTIENYPLNDYSQDENTFASWQEELENILVPYNRRGLLNETSRHN
ncbi:ATP-dependent DNA helicase RecQ [Evansella vedderi]|uniref:ATP-dependent DNA helicase RecQ n=1 Tax=Evansella vedderi TaxID=38282 RepID=A0ABU0A2F4_9BACI|nr:ATP-dependent DNA helicase RecQ [Evansella vedderi]MDQ0257676.1 ATP-dependent DNA helicase RecQ [Evansella vedderi]